jgi:hypothetical protein
MMGKEKATTLVVLSPTKVVGRKWSCRVRRINSRNSLRLAKTLLAD